MPAAPQKILSLTNAAAAAAAAEFIRDGGRQTTLCNRLIGRDETTPTSYIYMENPQVVQLPHKFALAVIKVSVAGFRIEIWI